MSDPKAVILRAAPEHQLPCSLRALFLMSHMEAHRFLNVLADLVDEEAVCLYPDLKVSQAPLGGCSEHEPEQFRPALFGGVG